MTDIYLNIFLFYNLQNLSIAIVTVKFLSKVKQKKIKNLSSVLMLIWYYNSPLGLYANPLTNSSKPASTSNPSFFFKRYLELFILFGATLSTDAISLLFMFNLISAQIQ